MSDCPLCVRERKTKWLFENHHLSIFYCDTCHVPLVVCNRHTMLPTDKELNLMEEKANYWGKEIYGEGRFYIDQNQRKIKDHLHWHVRVVK